MQSKVLGSVLLGTLTPISSKTLLCNAEMESGEDL